MRAVLGGYFGGRMAEAGMDVTFLSKREKETKIRKKRFNNKESKR